ncbi:neuronal acetylcholine receptor subunit alpha-3-like [Ylistrum balloti]|uniref:neuronal acetylcholine receptor subunit alpha-3-like n=1 Tax=Ylistrum balloti TaxID=509963 RepID=UPI002905AAB8|nr:neuronal acetylcholine receptor subunit alpha-3-like [Ylistrum balloti]
MTKSQAILFLMCTYVIVPFAHGQGTMDDLVRLRNTLFQNYTKDFRPVYNLSDVTYVSLDMLLVSIVDLDEIRGIITLNCGIPIAWTDYHLVWNPSDFSGITSFVFNSSNVWRPRVYITTSSNDLTDLSLDAFDLRVYSNGTVTSSPGRHVMTSCNFDMTRFPTDSQTCTMQLASWIYPANEIIFIKSRQDIDLEYYRPNGEWNIEWTSVTNKTDVRTGFSTIDFSIHLTRRSRYFMVSMTMPVLLLCFLNPFVFVLPASSGERISYTITVFLSLAVYMTLIGENMPQVAEPMAGISYLLLVAMLKSCVLIVLTIFTLRCDSVTDVNKFPGWLLWLACRGVRKSAKRKSKVDIAEDISVDNVKEDATTTKGALASKDQALCNIVCKEEVMFFIDISLFCLTFLMVFIICSAFALSFWL